MIALPVGENRMIVASFVSTKHWNVTEDGQTDGRTDGRTDPIMAYTAVSIASYADGCKDMSNLTVCAINCKRSFISHMQTQ